MALASHPLLVELAGVHVFLAAAAGSSAGAAALAAQHAAMLAKLSTAAVLPLLVAAELVSKAFRKTNIFSDRPPAVL